VDKPETKVKEKDTELREVLDKIPWRDYIEYGSIRIQIRDGKRTMLAVERTYIDF